MLAQERTTLFQADSAKWNEKRANIHRNDIWHEINYYPGDISSCEILRDPYFKPVFHVTIYVLISHDEAQASIFLVL